MRKGKGIDKDGKPCKVRCTTMSVICPYCAVTRDVGYDAARYIKRMEKPGTCRNCSWIIRSSPELEPFLNVKWHAMKQEWGSEAKRALFVQMRMIRNAFKRNKQSNRIAMFLLPFSKLCPFPGCGRTFNLHNKQLNYSSPSVDKDPKVGYTEEGLRAIICVECNRRLNDADQPFLKNALQYLEVHNSGK